MISRKILFIVEGQDDEPQIINKTSEIYGVEQKYEIYSYNTTIHELIRKLFPDGKFDEEIDFLRLLAMDEGDPIKKEMLLKKYTDVFLVFDFDPHYQCTRFDTLKILLNFFDDSTMNGKLFINYPMMQSYKHLKCLPDYEYKDRKVSTDDCSNYKEIVGRESKFTECKNFDFIVFTSIILHNIMKINYLINSHYEVMSLDELENLDYIKLLELEINNALDFKEVDVVNTYVLSIFEYAPKKFIKYVNDNTDRFLI